MNLFKSSIVAVAIAGTSLGLAAGSAPLAAQQASLDGSWSGTGTVQFASGQSETARCRASFSSRSGNSVSMNAVCATASGRVAQTAQLQRVSANRFEGDFHNAEGSAPADRSRFSST